MPIQFPIRYHGPERHHGHWSFTDAAGREVACPHTPPDPQLVELILGLNPAPAEPVTTPTPPAPRAVDTTSAAPSPAMMPPLDTLAGENTFALTPTMAAWEWMQRNGVSVDRLREILQDPATEVTPAPGYSDRFFYRGGGYRILVVPEDNAILGIYPTVPLNNGAWEKQRHSGTKRDHRLPVPTSPAEMLTRLQSRGFTTDHHRGHYEIRHPQHPAKRSTMASTPSDHRWAPNFIAEIRATYGIDLRDPDSSQ